MTYAMPFMYALSLLWTGTIPTIPLLFGLGSVIAAVANVSLLLSAVALWLEREHPTAVVAPVPFGDEVRLAA